MRAVLQRVTEARVSVDGNVTGEIGPGIVVLAGVAKGDTAADADYLAAKLAGLRIFDDEQGQMNLSVKEIGGAVLVVSQFTLLGATRKGRRPSFDGSASAQDARPLYEHLVQAIRAQGLTVATGVFQADMRVSLINDGPVTFIVDTRRD